MKINPENREKEISFYVSEIEDYMRPNDYQRDFFESLSAQFEKNHSLSDKQYDALVKIYERVTS